VWERAAATQEVLATRARPCAHQTQRLARLAQRCRAAPIRVSSSAQGPVGPESAAKGTLLTGPEHCPFCRREPCLQVRRLTPKVAPSHELEGPKNILFLTIETGPMRPRRFGAARSQ